jgi:threonine dehydrogenase-like Zn-dependent dehydrogenase
LKAAVYEGPRNIKVKEVPKPSATSREVLVKLRAGSICGTDLHFYRGEWTNIRTGLILGHDACGVRIDTGERVVMVPIINCGKCFYCLQGMPNLCENGKTKGFDTDGFFSEYVAMPRQNLLAVPREMSDEEAGIIEPVALAIHSLDLLQPKLGDWVAIIGQGAIGLLTLQIAKLKGTRVMAIDLRDYRLKLSRRYGADITVNPKEENTVKRIKEVTERGVDIVIEAAGTTQTVELTPRLVRPAGKVALIGEMEGNLNLGDAAEAQFFAGYLSPRDYPLAIDLVSKKTVDVKGLVTHRFKLAEFERAIETANSPELKPVKVVVSA